MKAWEQFLEEQEKELGQQTVKKWLRSLKIQRFDACNLYLEAKDSFQALWFEEHIREKVEACLVNGNHKSIKVHLCVVNKAVVNKTAPASPSLNEVQPLQFHLNFDELDPHCLFQHFVVSEDNQFTYTLLSQLAGLSNKATTPLGRFNPIYLYGPSGCGKTHLMMSLTQRFRTQGYQSLYARAELFTDHVVKAIRAGEMSRFRQAYRKADILLIDDLHVFSRKGATQEEFFHTFNTLHLQGKQIILSANCAPSELQFIEPRLVSRFEWGIVLPLKPLKDNDIKHLLQAKAQALQFSLPQNILDFLVATFTSTPKALIKAFEALVLRLHLDAQNSANHLSPNAVKILLSDLLSEEQKSALTAAKIIQTIAEHYGIRSEDILGKSQTRECALPRQVAMHLCREKLKMSYIKIGDLFSRDHSTVMTSVKHIQKSLDDDHRDISRAWHAITKKLIP